MADTGSIDIVSPIAQEGTTAAIRTWFKAVGDLVREGEPLVELETDKVAMEVAAPASGRLVSVLIAKGDVAPGALLGRIEPGGDVAALPSTAPPAGPLFTREMRLSPAVRKLVSENGIDPSGLAGSGKDGRLTRDDVVQALEKREAPKPVAAPQSSSQARATQVPHSPMRRRIAEHMAHSVATAPHVTAVFEADLTAIMAHRAAQKAVFAGQGVNLTFTAYFVQACIEAMKVAPSVNSRWHDDYAEIFSSVNIGIGTALGDQGLIVPVIHEAQSLSLLGIATRLQDVTQRARAGKLITADMRDATFTISNHGVSGSLIATPIIINQPQSAILGIGKLENRVVVREIGGSDAIMIRPMSYVSLTIDHRIIDGAQTNAWLTRFVDVLENWPVS